jgi:hypothetical protein
MALGATPISADTVDFYLIPADGNILGPAGSTIGWGYQIVNNSSTDYLLGGTLQPPSFLDVVSSNNLFSTDIVDIAPGGTLTVPYVAGSSGLFEITWDPFAPQPHTESGTFAITGNTFYIGDPLDPVNPGFPDSNQSPFDLSASYSASVGSNVPELSPIGLVFAGLASMTLVARRSGRSARGFAGRLHR